MCCEPVSTWTVREMRWEEREREVLVGQGHRPPALGPYVTWPHPRQSWFPWQRARDERFCVRMWDNSWWWRVRGRRSGRVISQRAIQRSKKISGIGERRQRRREGPRGFSQVFLCLSVCLFVCFNLLQYSELWSNPAPREGICSVVLVLEWCV
jgi:hypothetical protein